MVTGIVSTIGKRTRTARGRGPDGSLLLAADDGRSQQRRLGGNVAEQAEQRGHDSRVELGSRVAAQLADRRVSLHRAPVRAVAGHRVVGVADEDDPGGERDPIARESVRVAGPVPPLVLG